MTDYYPALRLVIAGAIAIILAALLSQLGMESARWLGYAGLAALIGGVFMAAFEGVEW